MIAQTSYPNFTTVAKWRATKFYRAKTPENRFSRVSEKLDSDQTREAGCLVGLARVLCSKICVKLIGSVLSWWKDRDGCARTRGNPAV